MDGEAIRPRVTESCPKLLQRPLCRGMGGHLALQDTSRSELDDDKHVEQLENLAVTTTMKSQATMASP
jgi:hypothetical protein